MGRILLLVDGQAMVSATTDLMKMMFLKRCGLSGRSDNIYQLLAKERQPSIFSFAIHQPYGLSIADVKTQSLSRAVQTLT